MISGKNKERRASKASKDDRSAFESFLGEEVTKVKDGDVEVVVNNEETISKKLSNATALQKFKEIGKVLFAMLKDIKKGRYSEVPWFTIASVTMALLYVLNPLDIVPDFVPGVGYIDDLTVMSIAVGWIESDLHKYLDWRLQESDPQNR